MSTLIADTPTAAPAPRRTPGTRAERVFLDLLDRHVEDATIRFRLNGSEVAVGRGGAESESVTVRVDAPRFFDRALSGGNLGLGESYMDGDWRMEEGDIADLLSLLLRNRLDKRVRGDLRTAFEVLKVQAINAFRRGNWRNVHVHYDLGDDLFESFLDPVHMMYSCGYAKSPQDSAEQLQTNKLERICQKLEIRPGDRLLDIGCGFGGMMMYAAKHYGATGVGITTSQRHCERGNQRIAEAGLSHAIRLELRDHRTVTGEFDRVVSIGMFEHLSRTEYSRFFARVASVLPRHGIGLVQTVGANAPRNLHDPFTQKYALPGTGQPKLSELAHQCEQHGLAVRDVENIVRHYALTVQTWLERYRANQHTLDARKYDARFHRMWEYYLSCAIAGGRASDAATYQLLFMKDYAAPMPLQRV